MHVAETDWRVEVLRYSVQGDFAKQNVPGTCIYRNEEELQSVCLEGEWWWIISGFILSRSSNPRARAIIQMNSFIVFFYIDINELKILIVGLHTGDAPRVAGVAQNVARLLCFCCCCCYGGSVIGGVASVHLATIWQHS